MDRGDVETCQQLIKLVRPLLPEINCNCKGVVHVVHVDTTELASLRQEVASLRQEVAQLKQADASRTKRIILGESAYTLDKVAVDYVMRGEQRVNGLTIGEIRYRADFGQLTSEQHARWTRFSKHLDLKGWSINDAYVTGKRMKDQRMGWAEEEKVTLVQLQSWAEEEKDPKDASSFKLFVQLVASFGLPGSPLVMVPDVVQLVDTFQPEVAPVAPE